MSLAFLIQRCLNRQAQCCLDPLQRNAMRHLESYAWPPCLYKNTVYGTLLCINPPAETPCSSRTITWTSVLVIPNRSAGNSGHRYTVRHDAQHTLRVEEIPSHHIKKRQVFVCILHTDRKQLQTYTWNCSLSCNFNNTIL